MPHTSDDVFAGDADWAIDVGDTADWVKTLPENSVHCCVTSPLTMGFCVGKTEIRWL